MSVDKSELVKKHAQEGGLSEADKKAAAERMEKAKNEARITPDLSGSIKKELEKKASDGLEVPKTPAADKNAGPSR